VSKWVLTRLFKLWSSLAERLFCLRVQYNDALVVKKIVLYVQHFHSTGSAEVIEQFICDTSAYHRQFSAEKLEVIKSGES